MPAQALYSDGRQRIYGKGEGMLVLYKTVVLSRDPGARDGALDEAPYSETLFDAADDFALPRIGQHLHVVDEIGTAHVGRIWSMTDRGHDVLNPMYVTPSAPTGRVIELCIEPMPGAAAIGASVH